MPAKRTKKQNLELIRTRLKVNNLPSKFKALSSTAIAIFADSPELDSAIKVIIEQNSTIKSATGRRLAAETKLESMKLRVEEFINPNKSEIIQVWRKFFDKVTKNDDRILNQIGAISKETAREDLEKAEQVLDETKDIAKQYIKKYGYLDKSK